MKPGYIFSAVFVVSLFMALGLPALISTPTAFAETLSAENRKLSQADNSASAMNLTSAKAVAEQTLAAPIRPTALPVDQIPLTSVDETTLQLQSFIASVVNNRARQVVGVYVPGLFALPIQQQPVGDQNYISPFDGTLTQYAPPLLHGVISLLAHNYLSGRVFFDLELGDEIILIYGDGRLENYRVSVIDHYQALSPLDPYSDFIDQDDTTATILSFQQVYDNYYKTNGQLVFQTCIEKNGDLSWGRIFIVAQPE